MNDEKFEEINLNKNGNNYCLNTDDNQSEITQLSNNFHTPFNENDTTTCNKSGDKRETKFYYEFMDTNKDFFERIGFKDIKNDPILQLNEEVEMKRYVNNNICEVCKKEISRIFTKIKFCKFCGCVLCDKCSNLKRKIPNSHRNDPSMICLTCENKFLNYELHQNFKEKLMDKEFDICEYNQKLEKLSLIYSGQLDDINKQNEINTKKKRENETKQEILTNETENLTKRTIEMSENSEKLTSKINESINLLKTLDEKKKKLDSDYQNIQKDRESITYEYEKRQTHLNEILDKVNQLSMSLKNHEQLRLKDKETGNKKLDKLLKEKMKSQRKLIEEDSSEQTTIIINPSKIIREVYEEPLLRQKEQEESSFKKFVIYMGSKIFI